MDRKIRKAVFPVAVLGHAVLCAERSVGDDPFVVLLAEDFPTDYEPGVTADLADAFKNSGKSELSVMEVDVPDISKYGVIVPNGFGASIPGFVETVRSNLLWFDCGSVDGFMRASNNEYEKRLVA